MSEFAFELMDTDSQRANIKVIGIIIFFWRIFYCGVVLKACGKIIPFTIVITFSFSYKIFGAVQSTSV